MTDDDKSVDSITDDLEDLEAEEAVHFNAETHINFMKYMFNACDVEFKEWVKCQTVDRAAVNMRLGALCDIPSIACCNHLLQSEVKFMK